MEPKAIKKDKILSFAATCMDLGIILLSEVSQRQTPSNLTYRWSPTHAADECVYGTETDSQTHRTDLWLPGAWRAGGGMEWEFGLSRCKLVYIEQINNKVLPYSTGKCNQYPVINHKGKNMRKNV